MYMNIPILKDISSPRFNQSVISTTFFSQIQQYNGIRKIAINTFTVPITSNFTLNNVTFFQWYTDVLNDRAEVRIKQPMQNFCP